MATMTDIEQLAAAMAGARDKLTSAWLEQHEEIAAIERRHRRGLLGAIARFKISGEQLREAVTAAPGLFAKPRSVILHGIKAGYQKGRGSMDWDDDEKLLARIKRLFPELVPILIKTTEKPVKAALAELPGDSLKKLGVEVEDTGDVVVVRLADSDAAKAMKALLRDAPEEEEAEA